MFYVLDGELSGFCGDRTFRASAGTFLFRPATSSTASRWSATGRRGP
jgi:glyoxylate utilization-related uncharacterized protein